MESEQKIMGVFSDTFEEFKKAKPQEKLLILGGGAAAIAIALYIHNQNTSAQPTQSATGAGLTGGQGGGGGIQTVPGPNSSNVPILPSGLVPLYDGHGNLIGYQPAPAPSPTPTPTPTPTPHPATGGTHLSSTSPIYAFNLWPSGSHPNGSIVTLGGQQWRVQAGSGGRIWGKNVRTGQTALIHAPLSSYTNVPQGGGAYGTRVLGTHGSRIAPTVEGRPQYTTATKVYAMRSRGSMPANIPPAYGARDNPQAPAYGVKGFPSQFPQNTGNRNRNR